ncbi:MAG: hypothetical protein KC933_24930 [Myxococcales bacterium]|nr:hypothetical protein [Myxococcales bacterium]
MRMPLPFFLFSLALSCTDRVESLQGGTLGNGNVDAGPSGLDGGIAIPTDAGFTSIPANVFDTNALPVAGNIYTLFSNNRTPRPAMQGPAHTLVWTGRRYVAAWIENRGQEGLVVVAQSFDPADPLTRERVSLSQSTGVPADNPTGAPVALAVPGGVRVAWSTERGVWLAKLDELGALLDAAPVLGVQGSMQLQWLDGPRGPRLVVRPALVGERAVMWTRSLDLSGPDIWWEGGATDQLGFFPGSDDGVVQLVSARSAGGTDVLSIVRWDADLDATDAAQVVYEGDSAAFTAGAWAGSTLWATLWDHDRGRFLVTPLEDQRIQVGPAGLNRTGLVAEPGGERLVLVHEEGRTPDGNLPTDLKIQPYDGQRGARAAVRSLPGCVEAWQVAARADRVGVSWVDSCSQRQLMFTEVGAVQR